MVPAETPMASSGTIRATKESNRKRFDMAKWKSVSIAIACVAAAALHAAPPDTPKIRVGGAVQAANVIQKVAPVYPPEAKQEHIQGTVQLSVDIGADGRVEHVEPVSGPPLLVQASIDAVLQWAYKPTLLNGQPVGVTTTVDVNFTLSQ
jgi:TonB family protein